MTFLSNISEQAKSGYKIVAMIGQPTRDILSQIKAKIGVVGQIITMQGKHNV